MEFSYALIIATLVILLSGWHLLRGRTSSDSKSRFDDSHYTRFSTNLTELARQGKLDPVVGRDREINKVIQVLSRRRKNNIILFGKAGIGKTAIVEGLATAISQKKVPLSLQDKIVLKLDITSILAGTKYRGDFEKRFKELIDSIIATNKKYIVFIDEIHTIVQAGGA